MNSGSAIFTVSLVLLVPFLYYATSIPDVCALPPDPNFGGSGCTSKIENGLTIEKKCCWTEPGTGTGLIKLREKYCQTCTYSGGQETCEQKELQYMGTPSDSETGSGVLQDPSTESHPKASGGGFLDNLKNKITSSQSNTSSSNATK